MALNAITVSQLNEYLSRIFSKDLMLNNLYIGGEISNITYHKSGHLYFSIADSYSKVSCFMARDYVYNLKEKFQPGDKVLISGSVRVYKPNGTYSVNVKSMEKEGTGDLAKAFEELKKKLSDEGLFDQAHKKELPFFPYRVGIVTSDTGAALQDILKIIRLRNNYVQVINFPCLVQGAMAPASIVKAIHDAEHVYPEKLDVLIVGRGGGSPEDLACFNDEAVARAIYECSIPVISAVGHEIDFAISDFVADKRAETPTAAAQMAVPDLEQLRNRLDDDKSRLLLVLSNMMFTSQNKCERYMDSIRKSMENRLETSRLALEKYKSVLEANNPLKIMGSGYAFVADSDGKNLNSVSQLAAGDDIELRLRDGYAKCKVVETGSETYE